MSCACCSLTLSISVTETRVSDGCAQYTLQSGSAGMQQAFKGLSNREEAALPVPAAHAQANGLQV